MLSLVLGAAPHLSPAMAQSKNTPIFGGSTEKDEAPSRPWQDNDPSAPTIPEGVIREDLPLGLIDRKSSAVERDELDPVMAPDGSGLPYELWRGISVAELRDYFASIEIPPRSPALFSLWRRLITSDVPAPGGGDIAFTLLRAEALERTGLVGEALAALTAADVAGRDPQTAVWLARTEIALGNRERGCEIGKSFLTTKAALPRASQVDAALITGYCAVVAGDAIAAGLQARLAREIAPEGALGPDLLDAVASDLKPDVPSKARLTLLEYRIAETKDGLDPSTITAHGSPALLAVLARGASTPPEIKVRAAEKAASLNVLDASELAALYRTPAPGGDAATIERAALFKKAEAERTPLKKSRFIRAFLDESRRAGLYVPALQMMAEPVQSLEPVAEIGWFAETAVEVSLASGNLDLLRKWVSFAGRLPSPAGGAPGAGSLNHWLALAAIADPAQTATGGEQLAAVEQMALNGRFNPNLLHRLTTVLDALGFSVPIPLWDLTNRSPQPAGGHLPDTGVLSALATASKNKDFGRTVLLAMKSLGPDGAEGAHMIALGDSIRALKRAGLAAEAHRLGVEALFSGWPRATSF